MKKQTSLAERLRVSLMSAARNNQRRQEAALRGYQLSSSQAEVIGLLEAEGRLNIKQIGELISSQKSSPSRLLARMHEEGLVYISKDPEDKRSSLATLTPRGKRMAEIISRVNFAINIDTSRSLTTNEQLQLQILLGKLQA